MDARKLKDIISRKYQLECDKLSNPKNKALLKMLETPIEPNSESIDLIFRGNNKYNFTSRMKDQDLIALCAAYEESAPVIHNIDLSYNLLTDESIKSLARLIRNCSELKSLNLQGNDIEGAGAQALSEALQENKSIVYMNLGFNRIKTDGAMAIVELLFNNKSLRELNLANNEISHDGMIGLTSVLNWNNNSLLFLNLDNAFYSSVGQETAIHFGKMLQSNKSLEKLSLKKHAFTCDAIYIITEHLLENNKLRVLDLTANKLAFKGCQAIAKYLKGEFCALESLILSSNRLGHYGAKAIAEALTINKTLIHLDMIKCDIDDNGLRMIAESLDVNDTLLSLKLFWNHFDQESLKVFHYLKSKKRKGDWFWDFVTYMVDGHYEMAFYENQIPYDILVEKQYYI